MKSIRLGNYMGIVFSDGWVRYEVHIDDDKFALKKSELRDYIGHHISLSRVSLMWSYMDKQSMADFIVALVLLGVEV